VVKNPPINAGDMGSSPTSGRYPGEGTITYSRILAWEIPWTEEAGGGVCLCVCVSQCVCLSHSDFVSLSQCFCPI